ncbi:MAG: hypothetical protein V3S40_12700 [Kiloniellales bacterium]
MKIRLVLRLLSAALLCAALAACSFDERIADHAVKYNKTVEEAHNSLLLLNILRARDRRPMHFTAFSQVRGKLTLKSTGSLGLQIPFGGDASNTFPLTPKLELSQTSSPSFDIAILDSKEFIIGILSPIERSIFKFYLDQRWPPEVLLYLFIHKIDQSAFEPTPINSPPPVSPRDLEKEAEFKNFQKWIKMVRDDIKFGTKTTGRAIGPKLPLTELSVLTHLVEAEMAGLRLVGIPKKKPGHYRLCKIVSKPVLCVGECSKSDPEEACRKENEPDSTQKETESGASEEPPAYQDDSETEAQAIVLKDGKILGKVHLRSVQAILYYLGEVLRYQDKAGKPMLIDDGKNVLFDLTTDEDRKDTPIISVNYNNQTYYVAKIREEEGKGTRTKSVLALILQLMGLHKESKELPTTTAVETVGGGS